MWFKDKIRKMRRLPGGIFLAVAIASPLFPIQSSYAQEAEFNPGEAFSTRFAGTKQEKGTDGKYREIIDLEGIVGSVIDLREPGVSPRGQHWINEPQRLQVRAGQVGQVFGIAIDNEREPNIFLTSTSAFGLHLDDGGKNWMPGMWGPDGDPGVVYKLNAEKGYAPEVFARIKLGGRSNSGAALGNIAFDSSNRQLFVSDLETGMIHRLDAVTGEDKGYYDHGVDGRGDFLDVETGQKKSLDPVRFDPSSSASIESCEGGFEKTPKCWNFADFRRRIWGLGVYRNADSGKTRLYYALWSSEAFDNPEWKASPEQQVNSIWSVGISKEGSFDKTDVRREFAIPGFFSKVQDFLRAGASHPVSDIAFSEKGVMLLAERGSVRNQGLGANDSFSYPSEARVLKYTMNGDGKWTKAGRFDVGFYDRKDDGQPFIRAGSSGGVDFGYGYTQEWTIDRSKADQFAWMTGDRLCSAQGPCLNAESGEESDASEVHGLQGLEVASVADVAPQEAFREYPEKGEAVPLKGVDQSYLIDADVNIDAEGKPLEGELERNDATRIGDLEIYKVSKAVIDVIQTGAVHLPVGSRPSHSYPFSIHEPEGSEPYHDFPFSVHQPAGSEPIHEFPFSVHLPIGSTPVHEFPYSLHHPRGSKVHKHHISKIHKPWISKYHKQHISKLHRPIISRVHRPWISRVHYPRISRLHRPVISRLHKVTVSRVHRPWISKVHTVNISKVHKVTVSRVHKPWVSKVHRPVVSRLHRPWVSRIHRPAVSRVHRPNISRIHRPSISRLHKPTLSKLHRPTVSRLHKLSISRIHRPGVSRIHNPRISRIHRPSISRVHRPGISRIHRPAISRIHRPTVSKAHNPKFSRIHRPAISRIHRPSVSRVHKQSLSKLHRPSVSRGHNPRISRIHRPSVSRVHKAVISRGHKVGVSKIHRLQASRGHNVIKSRGHNVVKSRGHNVIRSRGHNAVKSGGHSVIKSRGHSSRISRIRVHNQRVSGLKRGPDKFVHRQQASQFRNKRVPRIRRNETFKPNNNRFNKPNFNRQKPLIFKNPGFGRNQRNR